MKQEWFEMGDVRRRKFGSSVWIPLRASDKSHGKGKFGYVGFIEEYFGAGSLAVPIEQKSEAEKIGLMSINLANSGYYDNGKYTSADIYSDYEGRLVGLRLVLLQRGNSLDPAEWHLHQDFSITLGLKREGDIWVSPDEGYIEVARLHRNTVGNPILLDVRAEHLKDYLCARNMGLYITSYFSRDFIVDDASFISWKDGSQSDIKEHDRWEGKIIEIHEGGHPYGGKITVFHVSRTDVNESDDLPDITATPTDENTASSSWEQEFTGRKLFRVLGELWREEWIAPAKTSPRVKRDESPPTVFFIVDEQGSKENKATLIQGGKWLWFKPDVIMALAHRRGGGLTWHTRDTGSVFCSPDCDVHFGINPLGLVNIYAKDVALLPEWQQQIWAGQNISPEGGVSDELLASQVRAEPAETQAPEAFLRPCLETLNALAMEKLHIPLFREHDSLSKIIERTHRFRAIDDPGLFALAKDVARITADNLNTEAMQCIVPPPPKTLWGSLKSLENLLTSKIDNGKAKAILSPLVGAYELRHADAHLPGKDVDDAFALLEIDRKLPLVIQGYQLLNSCVSSLYAIADVLKIWDEPEKLKLI
jgi:hypothetical protein